MSSIITIRHNFGRNGLLKHRDLPHIWKAPEFRHCRPLLLSLLQHFEVLLLLLLFIYLFTISLYYHHPPRLPRIYATQP
jgi:hypothetical protein